jgi:signal transduction histidine kinase
VEERTAELLESREQLRKLALHLEIVKEEERKRIARDIHDELGQNLLALRIDLSMLSARTSGQHGCCTSASTRRWKMSMPPSAACAAS